MPEITREEMLQFMREVDADMFVQFPEGPGEPEYLVAERRRWRLMVDAISALIESSGEKQEKPKVWIQRGDDGYWLVLEGKDHSGMLHLDVRGSIVQWAIEECCTEDVRLHSDIHLEERENNENQRAF